MSVYRIHDNGAWASLDGIKHQKIFLTFYTDLYKFLKRKKKSKKIIADILKHKNKIKVELMKNEVDKPGKYYLSAKYKRFQKLIMAKLHHIF